MRWPPAVCSSRRCSENEWRASSPRDPEDREGPGYGYAIGSFGPFYGHTGELPGYNSFIGHDPEHGDTVVTWASLSAAPDGKAPAVEMAISDTPLEQF